MKKKGFVCVCGVMICLLLAATATAGFRVHTNTAAVMNALTERVVILDPGHGGIDGGAVSADGLVEKEINLAIALQLRELLELSGFTVIMTRETDRSVHDPSANTIRQIKTTDIHNRFRLMQQYPNAIFLSIHQNCFTESKSNGAQFFYAPKSDNGKQLAVCLHRAMKNMLQPENKREIKPCDSNVYLIYHAETTAVLAECGFLSNQEEAEKLSNTDYQKKISFVLFSGLLDYYNSDIRLE